MRRRLKDYSLYLVITEEYGSGRSAVEIARAAIRGGVDVIQMREKGKTREELTGLGRKLSSLCKNSGVLFIVNDDPALAGEVNADGVHLGQEDIKTFPLEASRRILGPDKIIGVSTHSMAQFKEANLADCDYVAFGPVFRTEIKEEYAGIGHIDEILKAAAKPVVFIGGITSSNVEELLKKGARHISLIRSIAQAPDIEEAAGRFRKKIDRFISPERKNG